MTGGRRFASTSSLVCGLRKNWGSRAGMPRPIRTPSLSARSILSAPTYSARFVFDAAGVVQSDEQMLRVLNELTLQAGGQMPSTRGSAADALVVTLARKLKPE